VIKCVVFDMAGTTVEDTGTVAYLLSIAFRDTSFYFGPDEINEFMGTRKTDTIRNLLEKRVDIVHRKFIRECVDYYSENAREVKGASELFKTLRARGIKVALTTGFPRVIADAIIQKLGWADKIDISVTSDEVENGRPAPDMLWSIQEKLKVGPDHIMKVGDTFSDIEAGKNAFCRFVFGTSWGTDGWKLEREAIVISNLGDILEYL